MLKYKCKIKIKQKYKMSNKKNQFSCRIKSVAARHVFIK